MTSPIQAYQQKIKLQQQWQQAMIKTAGVFVTCANCEAWDRDNDQCGQYKMRPPVDVIIIGCDQWEQEIPF